jgi:PAS domain S-box-containing protein
MESAHPGLYQFAFDRSDRPMCIVRADPPQFTIASFNRAFKQSTRTSTENIIGKSVFDVYQPFDAASSQQFDIVGQSLRRAIENRESVTLPTLYFEAPLPDNQVDKSWWQIIIAPIVESDSQVSHLLCTTYNVTEQQLIRLSAEEARKQEELLQEELKTVNEELTSTNEELNAAIEDLSESEKKLASLNNELEDRIQRRTEALRISEKRSRYILDSIPQIAWASSANGEVQYYNKRWYDYTGLTFEETKSDGWKQVIHPDDLQYGINMLTSVIQSKQAGEYEIRERGVDGLYRWHLVRLIPMLDHDGHVEQWIGTATDIQNLKKLQQEKDDFISIASHELKTPLTSLKTTIQLLYRMKENPSEEKFSWLIEQANRSMHKVTVLVEDLLNVNRIKEARLSLNKHWFVLSELINGCCNHISIAGKQEIVVLGEKMLQVYADENAIDQVIVNLVNNAVKYAPDSKKIKVFIEGNPNFVKVSVKDSGPGIPGEQLPLLFNRYYQAEAPKHRNPGLGLGLYISSEIIKQHGGEMGVESEPGKGSTFWFTLPV